MKLSFTKVFFIALLVLQQITVYATSCSSKKLPFGNWNNASTWSCGLTPSAGNCMDTIIINEHVYITSTLDLAGCGPIVLIINDTLRFQTGKKLTLPVGSTVHLNNGGWLIPEGGGGNSNLLNIGTATIWRNTDGPLAGPLLLNIELIYFMAKASGNTVIVNWATAAEFNNSHFDIERSSDGQNFEVIGSMQGAGNSQEEKTYQFIDNSPFSGYAYYRIKQTDYNGQASYTSIISVYLKSDYEIKVYPNPTTDQLNIQLQNKQAASVDIDILSPEGKLVYQKRYEVGTGTQNLLLDTSSLPDGQYIIEIQDNNGISIQRSVVKS